MITHSPSSISHWRGVLAVPNTPFLNDGRLDYESIGRLADYMATSGSPAVLLCGIAAETEYLTKSERASLLSAFYERNANRCDLIVSVAGDSLAEMNEQARDARRFGASAINIRLPAGLNGPTQIDFIASVAEQGPEIAMLQDAAPNDYGIDDDVILLSINKVPQLVSFKIETAGSIEKIKKIRQLSSKPVHFCSGHPITSILDALASGVDAVMPTSLTATLVQLAQLMSTGKETEARAIFNRLLPLFSYMVGRPGASVALNKKLRVAEGVFTTDHCRLTEARHLPESDGDLIAAMVKHAVHIQDSLGFAKHVSMAKN